MWSFFTNIDQLHFGVWSFQPRYVIIPSYHLYLHCLGFFHANHVISEGISSWFDGPLLRHNMIQLLSYVDHGISVIFTVWRKKLQTKSGLKQSYQVMISQIKNQVLISDIWANDLTLEWKNHSNIDQCNSLMLSETCHPNPLFCCTSVNQQSQIQRSILCELLSQCNGLLWAHF